MNELDQKKEMRYKFLHHLYVKSDCNRARMINMFDLGENLGFSREETHQVYQHLSGEMLVEARALGGVIAITHHGIKEIEKSLATPDEPTGYFPPVNIINVQTMYGSQIQQGASHSSQQQTSIQVDLTALSQFIEKLKPKIAELELSAENTQELEAEIGTIEHQVKSSRPKLGIIGECLHSIRGILEGVGGAVAFELLKELANFL